MALRKRIAVIGLGSIGRRHARLLADRDDIEVELFDPNAANIGIICGEIGYVKVYASFEETLKGKPDMVLIATPHALHARQVMAALESGIDTLCEKPMSDRLDDARKMKEAAERTGKMLVIGFNLHFHPCLAAVKKALNAGTVGRVLHLHARVGTYGTLVNSGSRYQAEAEGALIMDYAHQPDIFYWLTRETPEYVYASAAQTGDLPLSSNPNIIMMNCEYASGMLASIHLNYIQEPGRHAYEIVGSDGWLALDIQADRGILTVGTRKDAATRSETITFARDEMYREEHRAFIDAVAGRCAPESPAASAIVSVAVCDAAFRSWKTHERVRITPQTNN